MRRLMLIAAIGLALSACEVQKNQEGSAANAASDDPAAIVAAVEDSWRSGSAETAMAHYAPDAVVFSTGSLAPTSDRNVVTRETAGFMAMKPADFTVTERNTQKLDDDTIVSSGIVGFTAQVGPARQMLRARFTQVLQKQPDRRWLIVHEHMSLPPAGAPLP
ncbi:SgcJ/EcaC family oxidoreductase [Sphingomonas sp. HDW15A]|uniref:SgcJ/EcaC family oxidoreductase n=1 Tax=Sphingomonas sp. HDW15A TaxID=2714942 RepID=UPI00140BADE8|nr:SgcJ/EcaC family oxidoreductase [Sphingomonas sp. HDW15A]QIK95958.1 SgcJ/EcaC family oxidoreductase [Sphingomonas sp. HDW15A]